MLTDPSAGGQDRPRQAEGQVERVQVAAVPVEDAAMIDPRPQVLGQVLAGHQAEGLAAVDPGHVLHVGGVLPLPTRTVAGGDQAGAIVGLGRNLGDQAGQVGAPGLRQLPEPQGLVGTDPGLEPGLVLPVAGMGLAAIAPRGPRADPGRLQHQAGNPGPGQGQGGPQSGEACADDADASSDLALRGGQDRQADGRRLGIPGARGVAVIAHGAVRRSAGGTRAPRG